MNHAFQPPTKDTPPGSARRRLSRALALGLLPATSLILGLVFHQRTGPAPRPQAPGPVPTTADDEPPAPGPSLSLARRSPPTPRVQAAPTSTLADLPPVSSPPPESPSVTLESHASSEVEVRVLEAKSNRPAAHARVELRFFAEGADFDAGQTILRRTDSHGFVRQRFSPGLLSVVAWNETSAGGPFEVSVGPAEAPELEIALQPTLPVEGRVVDASTGEGLGGAQVSVWTFAESDTVVTGADGTFLHPRFPTDAFAEQLRVTLPGFGAQVCYLEASEEGWSVPSPTREDAAVQGTGTPWVEIALVPNLEITGKIVGAGGAVVPGARIEAEGFYYVLPSVASRDAAEASSSEDGSFRLEGLRSDIGHSLRVRAEGFADRVLELEGDLDRTLDLGRIWLSPQALLSGVVLDPDGTPVEDILVELIPRGEPSEGIRESTVDTGLRTHGESFRTRTDPAGVFDFPGLSPGEFSLHVARDSESVLVHEVSLSGCSANDWLELRLPPGSLTLVGEVRTSGAALAGAEVIVERHGYVGSVKTDSEGRFRVAGLDDEGAYELEVRGTCSRTGALLTARTSSWAHAKPVLNLGRR